MGHDTVLEFEDEGDKYVVEKTGNEKSSGYEIKYEVEEKVTEDDLVEVSGYPIHPDIPVPVVLVTVLVTGIFGPLFLVLGTDATVGVPNPIFLILTITIGTAMCVFSAYAALFVSHYKNKQLLQEVSE